MTEVDDYFAQATPAQKAEFERLRTIVAQLAPGSEEVITYGMPGFKYKGKYLISFGIFKDHMSIFPGSGPTEALKDRLGKYQTSKGTIQFTEDTLLPYDLLKDVVAYSATRIAEG